MKRHLLVRMLCSGAAASALLFGGCGVLDLKKAGSQPEAATDSGETATGNIKKEGEENDVEKKKEEAVADEPPLSPEEQRKAALAAEEFVGLPQAEAEFILECRELAAAAQNKKTVTGNNGLVFDAVDLRELGANRTAISGRHKSIVATLAAYAARLKEAGIEFVVAPVPPKPVVYPDHLGGPHKIRDRRYDSYLRALYADLEKNGVRVADATAAVRSARFAKKGASFPRAGLELSPAGVEIWAEAVYKAVRRSDIIKQLTSDKTITSTPVTLTAAGENFVAKQVGKKEGESLKPVTPAEGGPAIVVVGDAHALAYGKERASLADQLTLLLGAPSETRGEKELGWKSAPNRFSPGKKTPNVKLVVWAFSAVDFLHDPSASTPKPAAPRRKSADRPVSAPISAPLPGALPLRDNPGLDLRTE